MAQPIAQPTEQPSAAAVPDTTVLHVIKEYELESAPLGLQKESGLVFVRLGELSYCLPAEAIDTLGAKGNKFVLRQGYQVRGILKKANASQLFFQDLSGRVLIFPKSACLLESDTKVKMPDVQGRLSLVGGGVRDITDHWFSTDECRLLLSPEEFSDLELGRRWMRRGSAGLAIGALSGVACWADILMFSPDVPGELSGLSSAQLAKMSASELEQLSDEAAAYAQATVTHSRLQNFLTVTTCVSLAAGFAQYFLGRTLASRSISLYNARRQTAAVANASDAFGAIGASSAAGSFGAPGSLAVSNAGAVGSKLSVDLNFRLEPTIPAASPALAACLRVGF